MFKKTKIDKNDVSQIREQNGLVLIIMATILIFLFPWLLTRESSYPSFMNTGDVGDTIGGITAPIVGLLGAILVYLAFKEQVRANDLIIKQFTEQKTITHRQNFEQTFFNMLNIHHEIVNNMECMPHDLHLKVERNINKLKVSKDLKDQVHEFNSYYTSDYDADDKPNRGRAFFSYTMDALIEGVDIADSIGGFRKDSVSTQYTNVKTRETFESFFPEVYKTLFRQLDTHLGHYYRNLYRIIKMIDEQKFSEDEKENYEIKYFYTSIVRSQLSDYEIVWLFFNGLFDYGKKFKPYIQEYTLLKILEGNTNETIMKFKNVYVKTAFEKIKWEEIEEAKTEKKTFKRKYGHERTVVD